MVLRKAQTDSARRLEEDRFHSFLGQHDANQLVEERQKMAEAESRLKLSGLNISKAITELAERHPGDWLVLRKHILDTAWAMAQAGLQVNFKMPDGEIARKVLQHSGGWQALMGLYFTLDPRNLGGQPA